MMAGRKNWTHAAGQIWPNLVEAGRHRNLTTYTALADIIGTNALSVGYALGPIQTYCLESRLAPLTVVVVNKASGVPGDGFIAWGADDLETARDLVQQQNWDLVGNPFAGFGLQDDEATFAEAILADPSSSGEVYRKVRDRGIAQRVFRLALLEAYNGCAMCGLTFPAALEAAHILQWGMCSDEERMDPANGLLLCSSHHRLFDDHTFRLRPDLTIEYYDPAGVDGQYSDADRALALELHGRAIMSPVVKAAMPGQSFIARRKAS